MKALLRLVIIMLIVSSLAACTQTPEPTSVPDAPAVATDAPAAPAAATEAPAEPTAAPVEPTDVPLSPAEQWAKDYGFGDYQSDTEDWAAVEAAAKEEGSVIVYSNSSRILDAAAIWETIYPDIKIEANDLGGSEVVSKVREEQKAGAFNGDIWFNAQGPDMEGEFMPNNYLVKYIPPELMSVLPEENQNPIATHSTETFGWIYNSELNDSCPISNWWELTDATWKGKIFMKDPINSAEDMGMLISAVVNADDFAAAYQELYGTDWSADAAVDSDVLDAGWLWLKKFAQNQPVGVGGSDDVWGAMAIPGLTENAMGWAPLSKYRNVLSGKAVFEPCLGLSPVEGVKKHNYVTVINQAPHPNAAKLFVRFALSEEAFQPWNQVGQYSGRPDIAASEVAEPFKALNVYNFDNLFVYKNISAYRDFYAISLLAP